MCAALKPPTASTEKLVVCFELRAAICAAVNAATCANEKPDNCKGVNLENAAGLRSVSDESSIRDILFTESFSISAALILAKFKSSSPTLAAADSRSRCWVVIELTVDLCNSLNCSAVIPFS